jgi:poly(3-hydroxybutyrate) depolymerase
MNGSTPIERIFLLSQERRDEVDEPESVYYLLHEILEDAEKGYPLDRSRVYATGHSHNGRFAAEYMRRHQRDIAALATLGNEPGQLSPK